MTQYLILTEKGKIRQSQPSLPISDTDLAWVNLDSAEALIHRLMTKIPGIVDCQVFPDKINWDTDSVLHILTIQ